MAGLNMRLLVCSVDYGEHASVSTCHGPEFTLMREHVWPSTGIAYTKCNLMLSVWALLILFWVIVEWGCCSDLHGVEAVSGKIITLSMSPATTGVTLKEPWRWHTTLFCSEDSVFYSTLSTCLATSDYSQGNLIIKPTVSIPLHYMFVNSYLKWVVSMSTPCWIQTH